MPFRLVYYSQQDPKWKDEKLGFGTGPQDTIGYIGCALTSVSMMLSGHGHSETPDTLNQKLKAINGFAGTGIRWGAVSQLYPQVKLTNNPFVSFQNSSAPLDQIDAELAKGQPVIVQVDYSNAPGLQSHYVMLIARKGNDYLMLDPWPYQTDVNKETYLMPRYSEGNPLQRAITQIIVFEDSAADGAIQMPGVAVTPAAPSGGSQPASTSTGTTTTPAAPASDPTKSTVPAPSGSKISVKVQKNGLPVYAANYGKGGVISTEKAGAKLVVVEDAGQATAKIGNAGSWLNVKASNGKRGFIDASAVKLA